MTVYIPRSLAEEVRSRLSDFEKSSSLQIAITEGLCDLNSVRSAIVRFGGTSLWVRTPFVYPFSCGSLRHEHSGQYHIVEGVDWLWLGKDLNQFKTHIEDYIRAVNPCRIDFVIFDHIVGKIEQHDAADEIQIVLHRGICNYNQADWQATYKSMLQTTEDCWTEYAANTRDSFPSLEPFIIRFSQNDPKFILDLGCGVGQTARSLASRFPKAQVYGIDSSEEAIAVARRHFTFDNLKFAVGDISAPLPFDDNSVDLIVSVNALSYGASQSKTANEVFRVLNPYGVLIQYSRMLESHMLMEFPRSFLGPTLFQLNVADWIAAGKEHNLGTFVKAAPADCPFFFFPSYLKLFCSKYSAAISREIGESIDSYQPWHTHATIVSSSLATTNCIDLSSSSYIDRLEGTLSKLTKSGQDLFDAFILGLGENLASLDLCPEGISYLILNLPELENVLSARKFQ